MAPLLHALQDSAFSAWVVGSDSIWAYPMILTMHTIGLGIVVGANAVVDFRLLGFGKRIPLSSLLPLFRITWWAFALNAATGVLLFMSDATTKSVQVVFYIKLSLIAVALVTMIATRRMVDSREPTLPSRARTVAVLSLLLWAGAITAGRLMAYL